MVISVYPQDAVFNVNNFSTIASVQYTNTTTTTEFILPSTVTNGGQILALADGVLQSFTSYELSAYNGITYSNVLFNSPLYASNLTIKTISVPNYFYVDRTALTTAVIDYSNTVPVTIRSNTYVVDGIRTTFALPVTANSTNKDTIMLIRNGVMQNQDVFTFPSSTLDIYGIDLLNTPLSGETVEIRIFDSGIRKYVRRTSMADRKVDKGYSYTRESDVKTTRFIAGYEKRRLNSRRLRRRWTFSYTNINGVEKEAIDAFYVARSGQYEAFSFDLDHVNESGMATVVFDGPPQVSSVLSASPDDLTQNFYTVSMVLREVDD